MNVLVTGSSGQIGTNLSLALLERGDNVIGLDNRPNQWTDKIPSINVDLVTADLAVAKRIAAELRESGGGMPGVRALGLYLHDRNRAQVSTNVHDHSAVPLRDIVEFVRERAEVAEAELIGLAPRAALEGFPRDVPIRGFDPERHLLEEALRAVA